MWSEPPSLRPSFWPPPDGWARKSFQALSEPRSRRECDSRTVDSGAAAAESGRAGSPRKKARVTAGSRGADGSTAARSTGRIRDRRAWSARTSSQAHRTVGSPSTTVASRSYATAAAWFAASPAGRSFHSRAAARSSCRTRRIPPPVSGRRSPRSPRKSPRPLPSARFRSPRAQPRRSARPPLEELFVHGRLAASPLPPPGRRIPFA